MNLEYREFPVAELRLDEGSEQTKKLTGYAAVFNRLSENLGGFREKIAPGAFAPGALSPKLYSSVFGVCLGLVSRHDPLYKRYAVTP